MNYKSPSTAVLADTDPLPGRGSSDTASNMKAGHALQSTSARNTGKGYAMGNARIAVRISLLKTVLVHHKKLYVCGNHRCIHADDCMAEA